MPAAIGTFSTASKLWKFCVEKFQSLELLIPSPPRFGAFPPEASKLRNLFSQPRRRKDCRSKNGYCPPVISGQVPRSAEKESPAKIAKDARGVMGNRYWLIVSTARSQRSVVGGRGELLGSSLFFVVLRYADQTSAATSRLLPDKFFQQRATINQQSKCSSACYTRTPEHREHQGRGDWKLTALALSLHQSTNYFPLCTLCSLW